MALTKIGSIIVANLKTTSKFVDHLLIEIYSDAGLTNKVGSATAKTVWDGSTYSKQAAPITFAGLAYGNTFYLRAGVVTPVSGNIAWSGTYSVAVGSASAPNPTYSVIYTATTSGITYVVTPGSVPSDLNHYEVYWNFTGTVPGAQQVPNWKGNVNADGTFHFFVGHKPGQTVYAWVRAVNTAMLVQTWTSLTNQIVKYIDPASTDVLAKGNTPPVANDGFTYSATTTSITWSWSGMTIYRADGTTTAVANGSDTTTTLTSATTYYFYPYYDEVNLVLAYVNGSGHGSTGEAFLSAQRTLSVAQQQFLQSRVALSNGPMSAATTSSGTGGGSGGGIGSCVRSHMLVRERTKGIIPARDVKVGDWLHTRHGDGWTQVEWAEESPCDLFVRVKIGDACVEVTPWHPFEGMDENCNPLEKIEAARLSCMHQLYTIYGSDFVKGVELLRVPDGKKMKISCKDIHTFFSGESHPTILTHNIPIYC